MASAERARVRPPSRMLGGAALVLLVACGSGTPPESTKILEGVVQATRTPQRVSTLVIDSDLTDIQGASSPSLPPVRRGASDLERSTTSLKPGELAIVAFTHDGDAARVETRSVTAATNRPGSGLDCGTSQTFVMQRSEAGEWKVVEVQGLNC